MPKWFVLVWVGCAGEAGGDRGRGEDEGGACASNADCPEDTVCLAYGSEPGGCAPTCSASADACGAEATCGGVGLLSVDVCQEPADEEAPPDEEERPRIPCATDADCGEYGDLAVCAEWKGLRDCTIRCDAERDCDPPALGGVSFDFLACSEDEGDASRTVCLPDEDCYADPMSCVSGVPGF